MVEKEGTMHTVRKDIQVLDCTIRDGGLVNNFYFTDEFDDYGKALRKVLAGLEALYDVEEYDIMSHLDWIEAPIQIHQGTADDAVPLGWSLEFSEQLKLLDKKVELYQYTGADHNLVAGSDASAWSLAMERSLEWFEK